MARKKTKANKGVPRKKVAASVARTAELPGESPVGNPWPKGYRSACLFTFDVDTEVSWVFRDVDDPIALSMGRYEPRVGAGTSCRISISSCACRSRALVRRRSHAAFRRRAAT